MLQQCCSQCPRGVLLRRALKRTLRLNTASTNHMIMQGTSLQLPLSLYAQPDTDGTQTLPLMRTQRMQLPARSSSAPLLKEDSNLLSRHSAYGSDSRRQSSQGAGASSSNPANGAGPAHGQPPTRRQRILQRLQDAPKAKELAARLATAMAHPRNTAQRVKAGGGILAAKEQPGSGELASSGGRTTDLQRSPRQRADPHDAGPHDTASLAASPRCILALIHAALSKAQTAEQCVVAADVACARAAAVLQGGHATHGEVYSELRTLQAVVQLCERGAQAGGAAAVNSCQAALSLCVAALQGSEEIQ